MASKIQEFLKAISGPSDDSQFDEEERRLIHKVEALERKAALCDELAKLLKESQEYIGGDWRERREAALAKYEAQKGPEGRR